jgi:hypothetical protein
LRKLLLLSLLILPPLALAACGESEEDKVVKLIEIEDRIIETIKTSATSTDPADCEALATEAYLEQAEFRKGAAAVEHCEKNNEDEEDAPDSVEVTNLEVDGSTATADAEYVGGDSLTGQTFSLALVEEDGDWKLDEITGFAEFDQEGLAVLFEETVVEEAGAQLRPIGRCIGDRIRELPRPAAEEMLIGGSERALGGIIDACSPSE